MKSKYVYLLVRFFPYNPYELYGVFGSEELATAELLSIGRNSLGLEGPKSWVLEEAQSWGLKVVKVEMDKLHEGCVVL